MTILYHALHQCALKYIPDTPIKQSSSWIAILLHSKSKVSEVKERNDFLWIKCHERITIRTLKHEYFSRHPLEGFELKLADLYPGDLVQVKHLRKKTPVPSQVIVLRAIEECDLAEEEQPIAGRGVENAIVINDDEEKGAMGTRIEDCSSASCIAPGGSAEADSSNSSPCDTQDVDGPCSLTCSNTRRSDTFMSIEQGQYHDKTDKALTSPYDETHDRDFEPTNTAEEQRILCCSENSGNEDGDTDQSLADTTKDDIVMEDTADKGYGNNIFEEQMEITSEPLEEPTETTADLLIKLGFAVLDPSSWHICEMCSKQLVEKSWTLRGPGGGVLCYSCCYDAHKQGGDTDALKKMTAAAREEYAEKYVREKLHRTHQNYDENAPYDQPFQLQALTKSEVSNPSQMGADYAMSDSIYQDVTDLSSANNQLRDEHMEPGYVELPETPATADYARNNNSHNPLVDSLENAELQQTESSFVHPASYSAIAFLATGERAYYSSTFQPAKGILNYRQDIDRSSLPNTKASSAVVENCGIDEKEFESENEDDAWPEEKDNEEDSDYDVGREP